MSASEATEFRTAYHDHVRHDVLPHIPAAGGQLLDLGGGIGGTAAAAREAGLVERVGVADLVANDENPTGLDFRYQGNLEDLDFKQHLGRQLPVKSFLFGLAIPVVTGWNWLERQLDDLLLDSNFSTQPRARF